jgi:hypothetical protein
MARFRLHKDARVARFRLHENARVARFRAFSHSATPSKLVDAHPPETGAPIGHDYGRGEIQVETWTAERRFARRRALYDNMHYYV